MKHHTTVKELPESERPYEKFSKMGTSALSDADLLAIILKSGTKEQSSLDLARQLLSDYHGNLLNLYDLSYEKLLEFPGIGPVKAMQLKAVAELSLRIAETRSGYCLCLDSPLSIADYYMEQLRHRKEEQFVCAYFDNRCHFLGDDVLSVGDVSQTVVSPRDIFMKALARHAVSIVVLHNHPAGDPSPSAEDREVTLRLRECSELLGIMLTDHIIIGDNCYFSFHESGIL